MPQQKLTKRAIDDAKPSAREYVLWDTEVRGLGLKVTPSGRKLFALYYRTADGTQRKPKIGEFGAITLDQAREIARNMLARVRAGGDPSAERKDARTSPTVEDAFNRFIEEPSRAKRRERKPLTRAQYKQLFENRLSSPRSDRERSSASRKVTSRLWCTQ